MKKGLFLYQVIDRAAIVLDIGCFYSKVGFAGEGQPRAIFPTTLRFFFLLFSSSLPSSLFGFLFLILNFVV